MKNVLICGLGAIGCIYADKFSSNPRFDLRVLVDEERLVRYMRRSRTFNGNPLRVEYILPDTYGFRADLIIIATKSSGLNFVINSLEHFMKDDTIILSLLNGITSEGIIAEKYGEDKVVKSYYMGDSSIRNDNDVVHDGHATIVFGTSGNFDERISRLQEMFAAAHINYSLTDDIDYSLWLKFMLNVGLNQVSGLYGFDVGQFLSSPKALELAKNLMFEVRDIAKQAGIKKTNGMVEDCLNLMKSIDRNGKTSMLQDILANRKPEIDLFADTVIQLGQKYNVGTPYNLYIKSEFEKLLLKGR